MAVGAEITVTIEDPLTPARPDHIGTAEVYEAPWNPGEFRFDLDLRGLFDIEPGQVVTVTDGTAIKQTTVTNLAFTDIDLDTDIVTGVAGADADVNVWICDDTSCNYNRHVTADDTTGVWEVDFSWWVQGGTTAIPLISCQGPGSIQVKAMPTATTPCME